MWKTCDTKFIIEEHDDEIMDLEYILRDVESCEWLAYDIRKARTSSFIGLNRMGAEWRWKIK